MTKKQIEIKQNIIKKNGEITNIEQYIYIYILIFENEPNLAQMYRLGRTWPNYVGRNQPNPCEQCPPLFTCYVNNGGQAGTKSKKQKGRRADLWWLLSLAELLESTGSGAGGSRWPVVLLLLLPLSSVFSVFSLSSLFLLFSLLFFFFSLLFPLFFFLWFFLLLPYFYKQK